MGVLFNEAAFTFDQAPFQNSANMLVATDLLVKLTLAFPASSYPQITNWLAPLESFAQDGLASRETNVNNINVQGEFLSTGLWTVFDRIGTEAVIPSDTTGVDGYALHSQALLTAYLQSIQTASPNQTLNDATFKMQDLIGMIFDKKLFAYPTGKNNDKNVNFLEHLVRHEAGVQGLFAADGMVTRYTTDLWKIAQEGGLTLTNTDISKTLIAFAMQMYYENTNATDINKHLFSDVTGGGGIHFDRNDVAATLTAAKGYTQYFMSYLASLPSAERQIITQNLPNLMDWYIQAGSQSMFATAGDQRAFMLGGFGDDSLTGSSLADVLDGNAGVDILIGGSGDDSLIGGAGNDTLNGGDGYDTYLIDGSDIILDSDGRGRILDKSGRVVTGSIEKRVDGSYVFLTDASITVNGGTNLTLAWTDGSRVVIQNFNSGDLGIRLVHEIATDFQSFNVIDGDQAPLTDSDGNILYDAWGNIIPTGPEPDRADTIYDTTGNDAIFAGGGNDLVWKTRGGDDVIDLGAGDDEFQTLLGATGRVSVFGGDGRDLITAGSGQDIIQGGAGADLLGGTGASDVIYGDVAGLTSDFIAQGATQLGTGLQGEWVDGAHGDDQVFTGAGNDLIAGGDGNDIVITGGGTDWLKLLIEKERLRNWNGAACAVLSGRSNYEAVNDCNYQPFIERSAA